MCPPPVRPDNLVLCNATVRLAEHTALGVRPGQAARSVAMGRPLRGRFSISGRLRHGGVPGGVSVSSATGICCRAAVARANCRRRSRHDVLLVHSLTHLHQAHRLGHFFLLSELVRDAAVRARGGILKYSALNTTFLLHGGILVAFVRHAPVLVVGGFLTPSNHLNHIHIVTTPSPLSRRTSPKRAALCQKGNPHRRPARRHARSARLAGRKARGGGPFRIVRKGHRHDRLGGQKVLQPACNVAVLACGRGRPSDGLVATCEVVSLPDVEGSESAAGVTAGDGRTVGNGARGSTVPSLPSSPVGSTRSDGLVLHPLGNVRREAVHGEVVAPGAAGSAPDAAGVDALAAVDGTTCTDGTTYAPQHRRVRHQRGLVPVR